MADTSARLPLGATLTLREKLILMSALLTAMFLFALDQSIVSTAVPRIVADLGGFSSVGWVFTLYLLASTITIPIVGKLSDMFGRRNFLLFGVGLFVIASLGCGLASSMTWLIAMRGVQGIGGGMIVSCVFATLGDLFTPLERARYFAFMTGMFTFSLMAGPTVGGFLTDGPGWRYCFYMNLPLGLVPLVLISWRLPAGGGTGGRFSDIDVIGSGLLAVATIAGLLGVTWAGPERGWGASETVVLLATAAVGAVMFVLQERRHPHAIIPLPLFRNLVFVQSVGMTILAASCIFGAIPYLPTFVQTSLGGTATESGLIVVPRALGLLGTSIVSGQLVARTGRYKPLMVLGAALILAATVLLRFLPQGNSLWVLAATMGLMGLGEGMVFPMSQVVVQAAVSQAEQGVAASTRQFTMQIAQSFGVGIFGLLLASWYLSGFVQATAPIEARMPTEAYAQFKDPTLALDRPRFEQVSASVAAQPDGGAVLGRAREAQRQSVAAATEGMFTVSVIAAALVLVIALMLRPISLSRGFEHPQGLDAG
ncbi:MAG: MDR family MFS transporter [Dehalococcoidia bacterium]